MPHIILYMCEDLGSDYEFFCNRHLMLVGRMLVRHPDLSIQLWPSPTVAGTEALRARVMAAPDAVGPKDELKDKGEAGEEVVGAIQNAEEEEVEQKHEWKTLDPPFCLTAKGRTALLSLLLC